MKASVDCQTWMANARDVIVPNYPASHGCIRLPSETAHKFFSEIPIGTLVSVQ